MNMESSLDVNNSRYLFTNEQYSILEGSSIFKDNSESSIRTLRQQIKESLLDVCTQVEEQLHKENIDLNTHWIDKNKVSLTYPCPRNYNKVDWIGVRFGRSVSEIKTINKYINLDSDSDNDYGFLKFQNIQVNVRPYGLEIGLYHSIPQNTFDRGYVHNKLDIKDKEFINKLNDIGQQLSDYGFIWCFNTLDISQGTHPYRFDKNTNLSDEYSKWDCNNTYSLCHITIPIKDIRLLEDNIKDTILFYIKALLPLYNITKWTIPNNM